MKYSVIYESEIEVEANSPEEAETKVIETLNGEVVFIVGVTEIV
jgi:hypothetical protein